MELEDDRPNNPFGVIHQNYLDTVNYYKATKQIYEELSKSMKAYLDIAKNNIKTLSQIKTNISNIIFTGENSHYKYSDIRFMSMNLLVSRIIQIFSLEIDKQKSFVDHYESEAKKYLIVKEEILSMKKIFNDYENAEKIIVNYIVNYSSEYKNLFEQYNEAEDIITKYFIGLSDPKKKKIEQIFLSQVITETIKKEQEFKNIRQDFTKYSNMFYKMYENCIKRTQDQILKYSNNIKDNIFNLFSFVAAQHKTSSDKIEKMIEEIRKNEFKLNIGKILEDVLVPFNKVYRKEKYKIRAIDRKIIEDKFDISTIKGISETLNELGMESLEEEHIVLTEDNVYNIIKMFYGQFEFIDKKYYNLSIEKSKIEVKDLTNKLLYESLKKSKKKEFSNITKINEKEFTILIDKMNKQSNRLSFLQRINNFRALGIFELPREEFDNLGKIFEIIANKIFDEDDLPCAMFITILCQTFYTLDINEKIYLQQLIKGHKVFTKKNIWVNYLNESINKEIKKVEKLEKKIGKQSTEETKEKRNSNIVFAQIVPFCHTLIEYEMEANIIKEIIEPKIKEYKINEEMLGIIQGVFNGKGEGKK